MENKTTALSVAENTENKKIGRTKLSRVYGKIQKGMMLFNTTIIMFMLSSIAAFAESEGGSGGDQGTQAFDTVVQFFATWIGRVGLVVGFVGAVMFGLAIKNDDAEAKTRGLMTLASGFVVFAVTGMLQMFGVGGSGSGSTAGATAGAVDMISNFVIFTA